MYEYRAKVVSVYDADTITVDIDLGFGTWLHDQKLRLYGINAYEVRRNKARGIGDDHVAKGKDGRDWLRDKIMGQFIKIKTHKDGKGKFGRWLADIYYWWDNGVVGDFVHANKELVKLGHAWEQEY